VPRSSPFALLAVAACGGTSSTSGLTDLSSTGAPAPVVSSTQPAGTIPTSSAGAQPESSPSLKALSASDLGDATEVGLSQVPFAALEAETFVSLDDIAARSSAVVVARIVGPRPNREVRGDADGDVLSLSSVELEVLEYLAGTRTLEAGERLLLEPMLPMPEVAADTVWVMFLRSKEDDVQGRPNPEALPVEAGIWRQVNSQGLFIDRGDGLVVNPVKAAEVWAQVESPDQSLVEFVAGYDGRDSTDPVESDVAGMRTEELLDQLRN
jgi:hypothetical protein